MPNLQILNESQQRKFDSCPTLTVKQKKRYFSVNNQIIEYIDTMRSPINQVGLLVQLGYFRASGKFFVNSDFKIGDIKFCCKLLDIEYDSVGTDIYYKYSAKTRSTHRKYILQNCGWTPFDKATQEALHSELEFYAKQQMHPEELFPVATKYLINRKIELPMCYLLTKIISDVYNKIEIKLISIVEKSVSVKQGAILDELIWIDDNESKHYKFSALSKIKHLSHSTKIKDIEESIKNYKLLKAFYRKFERVYERLNLSETATTYYSEWVVKSKLFQLKQFKNRSKAHLYLLAHLKHQYYKQTDLYCNITLKLITNATNATNRKLEEHNSNISKLQKKVFSKIANSRAGYKQALIDILSVLNNSSKNFGQKDLAIREIIIDRLYDQNGSELKGDRDIEEYLHHSATTSAVRYKLFNKIGASLQRKLTPIICALDFDQQVDNSKTYAAISNFAHLVGDIDKQRFKQHFSKRETEYISHNKKTSLLACKGLFFTKVFNAIKSGEINIMHSYNFLSIDNYLISNNRWNSMADTIIQSCRLTRFTNVDDVLSTCERLISEKYRQVNHDYSNGANKHLKIKKEGGFTIATPRGAQDTSKRNKLAPVFAQEGIIPIPRVLAEVDNAANYSKCFKHHSIKKTIMKPTNETIYAGIISKGCNHGYLKMANISRGINKATLDNTINWFFSLENIQRANNCIVEYINKLSLPNIYKLNDPYSHTSSDGQKFNVGVNSILANYSFKYFGQAQGISVYTFIDDRHVLFYDTILSPGEREAAFVIDGLMANNVVNSHIHSTDTHGYNEVIFAVMHLLGISFAPRIKKIGSQKLYCVDSRKNYTHLNYKIKPDTKVNTKLIKDNWDDIIKLIATIKSKTTTASQIFKRLNSYTKEIPLYKALKEFGRVIKTMFVLSYIDDALLRRQIDKQLNKIESSNKFAKAVFFANSQEFRTGSAIDQKTIVACKTLIQNCIVLWNYLYLSQILLNEDEQGKSNLLKTIKQGSVISWRHINLHGEYDFTAANDSTVRFVFELEKIGKLKVVS